MRRVSTHSTESLGNADCCKLPSGQVILAGSRACYSGTCYKVDNLFLLPRLSQWTSFLPCLSFPSCWTQTAILASLCKVLITGSNQGLGVIADSILQSAVSAHKEPTAALPATDSQERALWYKARRVMDFACSFTLYHIKMRNLLTNRSRLKM